MQTRFLSAMLAAGVFAAFPLSALACSACGCSLDADWPSEGPQASQRAPQFELRFDYLNQNQLRVGSGTVNQASLALPSDDEIQQRTRSRVLTPSLDYPIAEHWAVNLALPLIDRYHTTIAPGDTAISTSKTHGLGDARVLFRYALTPKGEAGLQIGLKLPTGRIHDNFSEGTQAGEAIDRGLQAGTGTTDLLLGAFHAGQLDDKLGYFGRVQLQTPLNARDDFKPSAKLNLNLGLRYAINDVWSPQLQLNISHEGRESGANADRDNSGSLLAHLSPGFTAKVSKQTEVYGFVQLPVYQHVNGMQLEPKATATVGLRFGV